MLIHTELAPGIHRIASPLVNWYAVEEGGRLTIVDAGLPKFAADAERALASFGRTPADVAAVVLTHSDTDHTGLTKLFQDAGASVHIHREDEATLRKPKAKSGDGAPIKLLPYLWRPAFWRFMGGMARAGGAHGPEVGEVLTFADGDVLDVPGRPRVIHTPGHNPGQCAFHFARHGALFVGDELCTRNPLTGVAAPQLMPKRFNVSNEQCWKSLDALAGIEADLLLPGHGDPWTGGVEAAIASARSIGQPV